MKKLLLIILLSAAFISCKKSTKSDDKVLSVERSSLENAYIKADSIYTVCGRIDTAAFGQFIQQAIDYIDKNPDDSISPEMFYRAGIASMILAKRAKNEAFKAKNAKQAIAIFNKFQQIYSDNSAERYCYWQRAIIYEDILGDWRSAETEYRDFINRYPNDSLTPVFLQYLKFLGKNSDEINQQLNIN